MNEKGRYVTVVPLGAGNRYAWNSFERRGFLKKDKHIAAGTCASLEEGMEMGRLSFGEPSLGFVSIKSL